MVALGGTKKRILHTHTQTFRHTKSNIKQTTCSVNPIQINFNGSKKVEYVCPISKFVLVCCCSKEKGFKDFFMLKVKMCKKKYAKRFYSLRNEFSFFMKYDFFIFKKKLCLS